MHKRKYVMSNTAEAVVKAVRSAEALEMAPLNADECLRIVSDFFSIQGDFPYSLNGIPEMILNYVSRDNADMEALKPVIDGFVQLCRTDYQDFFNDSPNGGCKDILVEDYLGSESDRHALMVYIVSPFMENIQIKGHTNYQEARAMADALHELGYSVDIIKLDRAVWEYYEKEINESANIVYHGFMYRDDQAFVDLCGECAFSIGMSCSEGQSTAMLTTIFSGMVPICNDETGIDTEDYGGIRFESVDIGYLKRSFALAGQMATLEILTRAEKGIRRANELHTVAAFKEQLKRNINSLIEQTIVMGGVKLWGYT